MGGFFYAHKKTNSDIDGVLSQSRRQFELSEFRDPIRFETGSYIIDYYPKIEYSARNHVLFDNGDFIFAVGTFIYRGKIGADALQLFYRQPDHRQQLKETHGHFLIVLKKDGRTHLLRDPAGSYELFLVPEVDCASTSFLAASAVSPRHTINHQEVYEYIFNGVCFGVATPFAEIRRLDLCEWMALEPTLSVIREATEICPDESNDSFSSSVDRNLEELLRYASELAALFGDNISAALSGGYDSRLLLALFRHSGITPKLFVYGNASDQDVRIASAIAKAEGIELRHIDKSLLCSVSPDDYARIVQDNFLREDGLSAGGIFVTGSERIARTERSKDGALHVNGGGGEIFRNFFNLLDRSISPRQFVWSFYSGYDPSQCSAMFRPQAYEDGISAKIAALLSLKTSKLSRRQVEALYPYLRCRSWFARENSINSRWGYSVLPFCDHRIVNEALRIPIRYKHFGNFESALIRRASPRLASYPSNYGHNFSQGAPLFAVASTLLTYLRPLGLRRYAHRVKARLKKSQMRPALLSNLYLDRVIDTKYPYMSKYVDPNKLTSDIHFARMCTLEYLFNHFSVL